MELGRWVEVVERPHKILALSAIPKDPPANTKWRIISDASAPRGNSTNDYQAPPSTSYPKTNDVNRLLQAHGRGCFASVVDIKEACSCGLRSAEQTVYGYEWGGKYYVETRLPFGAKSAPAYFNAVGRAVREILVRDFGITSAIIYVDDILIGSRRRRRRNAGRARTVQVVSESPS